MFEKTWDVEDMARMLREHGTLERIQHVEDMARMLREHGTYHHTRNFLATSLVRGPGVPRP